LQAKPGDQAAKVAASFKAARGFAMKAVTAAPLPDLALLSRYRERQAFTDCYIVDIPQPVSLARYVEAFYTTPLFKLERFVLLAVGKPSTDADARLMARGTSDRFAAWTVESRADDQILLCDFMGKTRSWLMCVPQAAGTRLYFGSAVVPKRVSPAGQVSLGSAFRLMLVFHRLYAPALLSAAASRLRKLPG
jgi:hypothetical protein